VSEVLVVPRGRLRVAAKAGETGQLRSAGFSQSWSGDGVIPVALLPGRETEVIVQRAGQTLRGRIGIQFSGPATALIDSSCSPHRVSVVPQGGWKDGWIYVGCRLTYGKESSDHPATLATYVYWSGADKLSVDGVETPAHVDSVWALQLRSRPGEVELRSRERSVKLAYRIPDKLHIASIGVGIGPYAYAFETSTGGGDAHTVAPLVTLYASYFLTEGLRVVLFDAMALNRSYFSDIGLYLNVEQVRTVDRRLSLNLLLGAHVIGFRADDQFRLPFSAPQGFELIYRDFLGRNRNISAGSFLYPPIQGRSYYNVWLRWGTPSVFAEFNYISWREPLDGSPVRSRSAGVSIGFPLFRFL
jgi:hypothetical protein